MNQNTMVVDEEVQVGDNPGEDSRNVEGTVDPQQEGNDSEDTVMEEEDEGNQALLHVGTMMEASKNGTIMTRGHDICE